MSNRQPINSETTVEGSQLKVRHIDVSPKLARFLNATTAYKERFKSPSDDELRDLPSGIFLTRIGIARIVRNAGPRDHSQLICYRQPLLNNVSTAYFLRTVLDNKEGKYTTDVQEYVRINSAQMFIDFPFAFQMAYDIHTMGTITNKTRERKKIIDDRFTEIMENL